MTFATTTQDHPSVIKLPPRFDFTQMQDFHSTVDHVVQRRSGDEILVDFSNTDYLDSSALGMLLVLRDRARHHGMSVVLARTSGSVSQVLKIANFGKLFAFR